jgi:hypothetical protein
MRVGSQQHGRPGEPFQRLLQRVAQRGGYDGVVRQPFTKKSVNKDASAGAAKHDAFVGQIPDPRGLSEDGGCEYRRCQDERQLETSHAGTTDRAIRVFLSVGEFRLR